MKTFIHLVSVLILSIVLFACSNAHFLKEEDYRNQVTKDFEQKKQALPRGDLFTVLSNPDLSVYEQEALMFLYAYMPIFGRLLFGECSVIRSDTCRDALGR